MSQAAYGLTSNHAYWLSGLTLRDSSGDAPTGTIDAFSHGLGLGDPPPQSPSLSAGAYPTILGGAPVPYYGDDLTWGGTPAEPKRDTLDLRVTNLSSITVWPARAGLSCHPKLNVTSDGPLTVNLAGCAGAARSRVRGAR
jgi:hypothetical protein